ncbi:hypothetical protein CAEBREN_13493 [Caenorhabditis brenneri]|uniref:F-box domain-containing protein n=1 Tax=Caenorhabditis brenneri TaxID=135651 RepID=G0NB30_CAEBE|nr:hypothetical protein CAEBREN_13493 [Caenorhabditis brenneri]
MAEENRKFKLIQLPIVARQKLMKMMDNVDLFELSLCSIRMARYVRALRIEAERHNITLTKGQSSVSVHFRKQPGAICERYRNGPLSLNEYYCDYANIEAGTAAVSKHFQYLFNGPLNIVICPSILRNLDEMFSEPELQKCQTMEICGSEATSKALRSIFRNMRIEKKLVVRPRTNQDYVIEQVWWKSKSTG